MTKRLMFILACLTFHMGAMNTGTAQASDCENINQNYDACMAGASTAKQGECFSQFNQVVADCCKAAGKSQFNCPLMKQFQSHTGGCTSINQDYDSCMASASNNAKKGACFTKFNNAAASCCKAEGKSQFGCPIMKDFLTHSQATDNSAGIAAKGTTSKSSVKKLATRKTSKG